MKRQFVLMTALSLMTAGLTAAPALAGDDGGGYDDRWRDDGRQDRDREWDDDDDRWNSGRHGRRDRDDRWDHDDRWRHDRWERGHHYGWRHDDRRHGVSQREAVAIAYYRGMVDVRDVDYDDGRWMVEGWGRRGWMEIEISARTARILDIDYG